jgi:hypothetical protein
MNVNMNIAWSPEAIEDLSSLRAAPGRAAHHTEQNVEQLLPDNPNIDRAGRVPGTHEFVIPRIPYMVPYRCQHTTIHFAHLHAQRWLDRL